MSQDKNTPATPSSAPDPLKELARLIGLDDEVTPPPVETKASNQHVFEERIEPTFETSQNPLEEQRFDLQNQRDDSMQTYSALPFDVSVGVLNTHEHPEIAENLEQHPFEIIEEIVEADDFKAELPPFLSATVDEVSPENILPTTEDAQALNSFEFTSDIEQMIEKHEEHSFNLFPKNDPEEKFPFETSFSAYEGSESELPKTMAPWQTSERPLFEIEPDPTFKERNSYLVTEDDPFPVFPEEQSKPKYTALLVVAGLLLAGVVAASGTLFYRGTLSSGSDGATPVIKAETAPIKIAPENPGGTEVPNQNKQIYERAGQTSQDVKVISREEPAIELPPRAAQILTPKEEPAVKSANDYPDEPKKVKVLTIGPDGKVVGNPDTAKAVTSNPVSVPVPVDSHANMTQEKPLDTPRVSSNAPVPAPRDAIAAAKPQKTETRVEQQKPTQVAKVQEKPQSKTSNSGPMSIRPEDVAKTQPQSPAQPKSTASGGYVVQLSSSPSENDAKASFNRLAQKHSQLKGMSPNIATVNLGAKGTYYRLRVGPFDKNGAQDFCLKLKAQGGSCIVQGG